jgi:hypothetical protein
MRLRSLVARLVRPMLPISSSIAPNGEETAEKGPAIHQTRPSAFPKKVRIHPKGREVAGTQQGNPPSQGRTLIVMVVLGRFGAHKRAPGTFSTAAYPLARWVNDDVNDVLVLGSRAHLRLKTYLKSGLSPDAAASGQALTEIMNTSSRAKEVKR